VKLDVVLGRFQRDQRDHARGKAGGFAIDSIKKPDRPVGDVIERNTRPGDSKFSGLPNSGDRIGLLLRTY